MNLFSICIFLWGNDGFVCIEIVTKNIEKIVDEGPCKKNYLKIKFNLYNFFSIYPTFKLIWDFQ